MSTPWQINTSVSPRCFSYVVSQIPSYTSFSRFLSGRRCTGQASLHLILWRLPHLLPVSRRALIWLASDYVGGTSLDASPAYPLYSFASASSVCRCGSCAFPTSSGCMQVYTAATAGIFDSQTWGLSARKLLGDEFVFIGVHRV